MGQLISQLSATSEKRLSSVKIGPRARREIAYFYLCISPWLLGFIFLTIAPLIMGFGLSLSNFNGLNWLTMKFVGAANYAHALNDIQLWTSLQVTLLFAIISVPIGLAVSMGMALLVNQEIRGRGFFRTLLYLPSFIPVVAGALAWRIFADKNSGLINGLLSWLRPGTALPWLTDLVPFTLLLFVLWGSVGSGMVVLLGGLQAVPRELREAALVDGANEWQAFRHVTLPMMSPVLFFQLIIGIIGSLQLLVQPMLLASFSGNVNTLYTSPPQSIYMYLVYVFIQIFGNQNFSYGMALLWILFIIVLLLTLLVFRTSRGWVHYEVEQ
ncbi:MAG: sugar ABC transporter permease [Anaerolineaceae bacterium]|nr:sugar ABC transporter permease [Anaerolineaceae bacterium]